MMMGITFSHPQYLFLLLLIPALIVIHFLMLTHSKKKALMFANFSAIARIKGVEFFSRKITVLIVGSVILLTLIFGVSGMILQVSGDVSSYSFVLAFDVSESMSANDISPTRIDAAKEAASNLVRNAPTGTEFGVLTFSGNSFVEQEVTGDRTAIFDAIDSVRIGSVGGTDIFEAMVLGANLLQGREGKSIIIVSDGQLNVGNVVESIEYAQERNVVVHTVGIGTSEGGEASFGISKLDEDTLRSIAFNTGGTYFSVSNLDEINQSFEDALELTEGVIQIDLTRYLIITAIILFFLVYLLFNLRTNLLP